MKVRLYRDGKFERNAEITELDRLPASVEIPLRGRGPGRKLARYYRRQAIGKDELIGPVYEFRGPGGTRRQRSGHA